MGIFPSGSQTPVWEPAPAKLRFASTARQSQRETEFRGDSYPNRVRVRVAGAISWFPNSRLGTRSSEALFRVPRDSLNAKQRFAKNGANWHNWSSGADWSHYRRKSLQT